MTSYKRDDRTTTAITVSRRTVLGALGAGVLGAVGGVASADDGPERLFSYDPTAGELPENIAIDRHGAKYVSMNPRGEIWRVTPDNRRQSTFASFDIGVGPLNGLAGLEVDPTGTIFACLNSGGTGDTHGIWQVTRDGEASVFAALPTDTFPNDLTLDGHSLLVTDTIGGTVLRVDREEVTEWASGPLLEGTGEFGFGIPIGANGITRGGDGTVYVGVAERGHIVEIPVRPDGSAGRPELFVADPRLLPIDGLAIDTRDDLYAAIIGQNTVVRVTREGHIETLATAADDLDNPSDVTFGTSRGEQTSVFITNFAFLSQEDPSLMKLDVGVPGVPVHR